MKKKTLYFINEKYKGCEVGTREPIEMKRLKNRQPGLFILDDTATQEELAFLHDVVGMEQEIGVTSTEESE